MECVLLWLDELDDLVSTLAMQAEALRRVALRFLAVVVCLAALAAVALIARLDPMGAAAVVALLLLLRTMQRRTAFAGRQPAALQS